MYGAGDTRAMTPSPPQRHPDVDAPARPQPGLALRALRGLSGVLTGGLVVLAAVVAATQWVITSEGRPGPGLTMVTGHLVAALAAVLVQVVADRSRGVRAALASLVVLVIVGATLWFGWWA